MQLPPPVPALINPAIDALRGRGGSASTRELATDVATALGLSPKLGLMLPGGEQFRAALHAARAVLEAAALLERRERGVWSLAPGVVGHVADPEALVRLVRAQDDPYERHPLALVDWRVGAASTGTLDPAARIAAALLRGRAALEAGAPLRLELEEMEAVLRRSGSVVPPASEPGVDSSAIDRAAREVSPAAGDRALLHLAERVLGILAPASRDRTEDDGHAGDPGAGPAHGPPRPKETPLDVLAIGGGGRIQGRREDDFRTRGGDTVVHGIGGRDHEETPQAPPRAPAPRTSAPPSDMPSFSPAPPPEKHRREQVDAPAPELDEVPIEREPHAAGPPPMREPDEPRAAEPEAAPPSGTGGVKPPRFPDFRVLRRSGEEHDARRPLTVGETYVLEVRVTPDPAGLPAAAGKPREAVIEPGQAAPVTLTVTVIASSHVEVPEPLDSLQLPPEGASTAARFELRATEAKPAKLSVRIYYRLNLLARARVTAEVADEVDGDDPRPEAVVVVEPERLDATFGEMADMAPRDAHIDVTAEDGAYEMTLAFRKDQPGEAAFRARVRLSPEELEDALVRVRETLAAISAEPVFNQKLEGSKYMRARHLRALAAEGRRLWGMLFHRDIDSAASELARVLKDAPLAPDSRLQISVGRGAERFVFPWALLFPGDLPEEPAPPAVDGFWGTRYELEVRTPRTPVLRDGPFATDAGVKLAFALHPFPNAAEQERLLARLETESGGKLRAGAPVRLKSDWLKLLRDCDAQVLYFYTHGFTRQRKADVQGTGAGAPPAKDADPDHDRTWIQVPGGRLYLDELQDAVSQNLRSEPLVFLNMCESAQMTPSLSESLVAFFLDRGARTVIGTECPMTIYFAHAFSERLLSQVLRGDRVGKALLDARRHFIESANNTLGFAYSLYGTAAFSFAPPVLPAPAGD